MRRATQATSLTKPLGESSGNPMMLPPDHPHTRKGDVESNGTKGHSLKPSSKAIGASNHDCEVFSTHRRTRSSKNLMSLLDRDKTKPKKNTPETENEPKMQKSKSATGLSSIFSRPGSSKGMKDCASTEGKDKENGAPLETPIWKQFATQNVQDMTGTTKIPLNDRQNVQSEMDLYTPQQYSPSKQRSYPPNDQSTLSKRPQAKPRPKSECLQGSRTQMSLSETLSGLRQSRKSQDLTRRDGNKECTLPSNTKKRTVDAYGQADSNKADEPGLTAGKRGSRVMAAVAAFNGKSKELPKEPVKQPTSQVLDPKEVEKAFESLLVLYKPCAAEIRDADWETRIPETFHRTRGTR